MRNDSYREMPAEFRQDNVCVRFPPGIASKQTPQKADSKELPNRSWASAQIPHCRGSAAIKTRVWLPFVTQETTCKVKLRRTDTSCPGIRGGLGLPFCLKGPLQGCSGSEGSELDLWSWTKLGLCRASQWAHQLSDDRLPSLLATQCPYLQVEIIPSTLKNSCQEFSDMTCDEAACDPRMLISGGYRQHVFQTTGMAQMAPTPSPAEANVNLHSIDSDA